MNEIKSSEPINRQTRLFSHTVVAAQLEAAGGVLAQSNELESIRSVSPPPMAGSVPVANLERRVKGSTDGVLGASEIRRIDPSAEVVRSFETSSGRLDLLRFSKRDSVELEFSMPCHLVILLTDGLSKGCEWSDGRQTRRSSFLAPNAVMFNPAQEYLRIRAAIPRNHCHLLVLAIQPGFVKRRDDLEVDFSAVQFRQKIGLNDAQTSQTLLAIQRELEGPGINGAFYVDTLLFLLLTRLLRCASNLAEPCKATYAKGGLPNWRLKRAIELLEGDLGKMPTVTEVAQVIGLHPTSFCRGFKHSAGLSPHRYILAHRVNRAKEMMSDQRLSLTEIALDCGFSGSSQFSVVFKRITGMSPREYRRAL